jgi:hypothetical protein
MNMGWIGVDFDGTLAMDADSSPIPAMVERVKRWRSLGIPVHIVTARVSPRTADNWDIEAQRKHVQEWCLKYIGEALPVRCDKDYSMYQLWDDRAVQVIKDTGERVGSENRPSNKHIGKTVIDEDSGYVR